LASRIATVQNGELLDELVQIEVEAPYGATSAYINHWMNREFGMKVIL
jgi:hypothetical protein